MNDSMSKSSKNLDEILKEIASKFDLSSEKWDDDYELRQNEMRQLFDLLRGKSEPVRVGFKRLTDDSTIPTKAHPTDSGFDLYASEDVIIEPGETAIIPTGIAVELPKGYEAQVRPRSGVTAKTKLRVQLGTIDNGYVGEIGVIVDNIEQGTMVSCRRIDGTLAGEKQGRYGSYLIRKGDRIAQLVIQRLPSVEAIEVKDVGESDRGAGGFGSSGYKTVTPKVKDGKLLFDRSKEDHRYVMEDD